MSEKSGLAVILAAGEGTRMKSVRPKVLHEVAGLPMLAHVLSAAREAGLARIALVVGHGGEAVRKAAEGFARDVRTFVQAERLGTAHAVLAARAALEEGAQDILVLYGDTPLITPRSLQALRRSLADRNATVAVLGFRTHAPAGYGRLIERGGRLLAIREEKDCSDEERGISFCNGGVMAISGAHALSMLDAVGNANAKGEFYLTDLVEIAVARGLTAAAVETPFADVLGVNNLAELAAAEGIWQERKRGEMMLAGVSMQAPETVYFSHDTRIAADARIEPHVWFGPGVTVAAGARIHAFSHIEGAAVGERCDVGPFARLRPGAELHRKAKVGNFCEVKKAIVEEGAKVNHLTYVGDARVGAGANIGAGTVTCNYDGHSKFFTDIGAKAFIGSNSSLVAPVTIGDGAYVASGSVITENVEADALAFGRARQKTLPGKGRALRERQADAAKSVGGS